MRQSRSTQKKTFRGLSLSIRKDGYARVKCVEHSEFGTQWVLRSHFVWWLWRKQRVSRGWCLHHKDEDRLHDVISNLQLMTIAEHSRLHKLGKVLGPLTTAHKAAIADGLRGTPKSIQHKLNLSKPRSELGRANIAKAAKMRVYTPELLAKMSRKGSKHTEATKALMRKNRKGRPKSAAHRTAIGKALKGRVITDIWRARLIETLAKPEVILKRSLAQKKAWVKRHSDARLNVKSSA